eukprot:gene21267-23341_t
MGLKNLHLAFADICPSLIEKFDARAILTLCVEYVFSEIRSGGLDMPLQLDFDRKFPKAVREGLKRQCQCSFNYFTYVDTYYPKITSLVPFKSLPKPPKFKTVHLSKEKIEAMRNWRAEHGQSVPQKTVRNLSTKDNPGTLPVNLYQGKKTILKSIDLHKLHKACNGNQKEKQSTVQLSALYEAQNVVCMKAKRLKLCKLLDSVTLSNGDIRSPKKAKGIHFKRDPFTSNTFYKGDELVVSTEDIICRVEEISYSKDQLEFTIEEEAYYNLLAHILEYRDQASTDEILEDEEEAQMQKTRRSSRKSKRTFQDFVQYDNESE